MARGLQWDANAWEDYCAWQKDRATLKRINALLKDIIRHPFDGIGKPEPLKHDLSGLWSRHVNDTDRLTYKVLDDMVVILACKGHYE